MKKIVFISLFLIVILAFSFAFASINQDENIMNNTLYSKNPDIKIKVFNLPASLQIIEDEAFEGTSITNVNLPEKVTTIGARAFANISTLHFIQIPLSTSSIEKTAFQGSKNVTIIAFPNSFARIWAKNNHIPFTPLNMMYAGNGNQLVTVSLTSAAKEFLETESSGIQGTKRVWRKLEDNQVYDTIKIIATVIQGRAPPKV